MLEETYHSPRMCCSGEEEIVRVGCNQVYIVSERFVCQLTVFSLRMCTVTCDVTASALETRPSLWDSMFLGQSR
jgi:hypothetical protein